MNYIKEVAEREEHVVKETQEAEDVEKDMNVIDFDEFGSGEDSVAANIVKKDRKCNIQPTSMGLPSTPLDEGTSKSQPLPEGKTTDPKDLKGP
ncbi:hypothetical protein Tco_0294555 [Tanacetum coccineum]